jgi:hypothetical protein
MRTTLDLTEEAYQIARTVARERGISLGRVVSEYIVGRAEVRPAESGVDPRTGFPTFRCSRRVTSEDVKALDEEP